MPMPIQRVPLGLLELLGGKGSGATPNQLLDGVVAVLDLEHFYLAPLTRVVTGSTATVNATGTWMNTSSAMIVPAGELWLVRNASVVAATPLGVGESCAVQMLYVSAGYSNANILGTPSQFPQNTRPAVGWNFGNDGLMLLPQSNFGVFVTEATALTETFNFVVEAFVLSI